MLKNFNFDDYILIIFANYLKLIKLILILLNIIP
jgi:hypothetical protein